jgi:hypothetical protein
MARTKQKEQKETSPSRSPSLQRGGEDSNNDEAAGGIFLTKDDIRLIYKL